MPFAIRRHRLTAWIAMFAILLGALAPAASQAMSVFGDGNVRWTEVCTTAGMQWIAVDADSEPQGEPASDMSMASCPYCCPHAGSFALPPSPTLSFSVRGTPMLQPTLYFTAPRPLFTWAASHPRAPPLAS
ncbi:MAG: DUF2946 domain-containing protein [Azoarcus sp.]|nr:DUF2946 domain-containing protein [Azoarcus sp.]